MHEIRPYVCVLQNCNLFVTCIRYVPRHHGRWIDAHQALQQSSVLIAVLIVYVGLEAGHAIQSGKRYVKRVSMFRIGDLRGRNETPDKSDSKSRVDSHHYGTEKDM